MKNNLHNKLLHLTAIPLACLSADTAVWQEQTGAP